MVNFAQRKNHKESTHPEIVFSLDGNFKKLIERREYSDAKLGRILERAKTQT